MFPVLRIQRCCRWIFVGGFTRHGWLRPPIRRSGAASRFATSPTIRFREATSRSTSRTAAISHCARPSWPVRPSIALVTPFVEPATAPASSASASSAAATCRRARRRRSSPVGLELRVRIFADGVELCRATAVIYDLNANSGGNGVNGADLGFLKNDVGAAGLGAKYRGRADYNCGPARSTVLTSASTRRFSVTRVLETVLPVVAAAAVVATAYCAHPVCPVGPCKSPRLLRGRGLSWLGINV